MIDDATLERIFEEYGNDTAFLLNSPTASWGTIGKNGEVIHEGRPYGITGLLYDLCLKGEEVYDFCAENIGYAATKVYEGARRLFRR